MIDLILWASTRADMRSFAIANGLMQQVDGEWEPRRGCEWDWWQGSGQMMRTPAVVDAEGNVTAPATFVPGVVGLLRLHFDLAAEDAIDDEGDEVWHKSRVARYIHQNGAPGTAAGLPYYEIDGVRLFLRADVDAKLTEWGVPSHDFL